ncbi:MAG: hypothetical protein IJO46_11690 [Thermoguttaceae bacterium]|nr:hypothetical protein [Thermoguttaceae bacterium]
MENFLEFNGRRGIFFGKIDNKGGREKIDEAASETTKATTIVKRQKKTWSR